MSAKRCSITAAIALAVTPVMALPALAECEEGETATVTGTIKMATVGGDSSRTYWLQDGTGVKCNVEYIVLADDADRPEACRDGKTMTATGTLEENEGGRLDIWEAHSPSCK